MLLIYAPSALWLCPVRTLFVLFGLTPQVGFEPTTNRLTVDRSTTELLRNAYFIVQKVVTVWQDFSVIR